MKTLLLLSCLLLAGTACTEKKYYYDTYGASGYGYYGNDYPRYSYNWPYYGRYYGGGYYPRYGYNWPYYGSYNDSRRYYGNRKHHHHADGYKKEHGRWHGQKDHRGRYDWNRHGGSHHQRDRGRSASIVSPPSHHGGGQLGHKR